MTFLKIEAHCLDADFIESIRLDFGVAVRDASGAPWEVVFEGERDQLIAMHGQHWSDCDEELDLKDWYVDLTKITPELLAIASNQPDLDEALYPLQVAAGIDQGDVAGMFFSGPNGEEWPCATPARRLELLQAYIEVERVHNA